MSTITYRVIFSANSGSFESDALASSVGGRSWNTVQRFDGVNDLAFIDVDADNAELLEELMEQCESVIEYEQR